MAEAPVSIFEKPTNKPKGKSRFYRGSVIPMSDFLSLPHAEQLRLDEVLNEGLTFSLHDHPASGRSAWVGKKPSKS